MIQGPLVLVLGIAMLNGLFSPALLIVHLLRGIWYPWFLPASPGLLFFFSSLFVATFTLMLGGVPAALYERLSGQTSSTYASMGIWLAGVVILTIPAMANLAGALSR